MSSLYPLPAEDRETEVELEVLNNTLDIGRRDLDLIVVNPLDNEDQQKDEQ